VRGAPGNRHPYRDRYFRAGKADALLIVCVPSDEPLPRGDLLTSRALSGFPGAWLAVPRLREVGLLPPAIGSRSVAGQRAAALRERRFPCDVIARWLDAEGYAAPNTDPGHWTSSDVVKLLREARGNNRPTLTDELNGAPAPELRVARSLRKRTRPCHRRQRFWSPAPAIDLSPAAAGLVTLETFYAIDSRCRPGISSADRLMFFPDVSSLRAGQGKELRDSRRGLNPSRLQTR
jgi:hypothetical protein